MKCPVDGTDMRKAQQEGVEIDYCPECRGVWLDRGELEKIVDRAMEEMEWDDGPDRPYGRGPGGYGGRGGPGGPGRRYEDDGPYGGGPGPYGGGPGPYSGGPGGEWEDRGGGMGPGGRDYDDPRGPDQGPGRRRSIFDIFNI